MTSDILRQLSGTMATGGVAASGQDISTATAAAPVYSTNHLDLDAGGALRTKRDLRNTFIWTGFSATVNSATDTATLDIEAVMMPYTALPAAASSIAAWDNTNDVAATVITVAAHGLPNGTRVTVAQTAGTLNTGTGYAVSTLLYVVSATTNTFGLSATLGGAAITLADTAGTTTLTRYPSITFDNTKDVASTVITYAGHTLPNGTRVTVAQTTGAINTGTGYAVATNLYVVNSTTDTFGLSATPGGAAITLADTTGTTVVTWFPEVVGAANKIGLERLIANVAQVQFVINPLLIGPGNGVPAHRYLLARYTPTANLTAGGAFCQFRNGAPMANFPINPSNYVTP